MFQSPAWGFCASSCFPSSAVLTRTLSWFGHGCTRNRMHSYHGRYHGSAMDALEIGCTCNTDIIMVLPWMLSKSYALVPWALSWFGHGCLGLKNPWLLNRCFGLKKPGLFNILNIYVYRGTLPKAFCRIVLAVLPCCI